MRLEGQSKMGYYATQPISLQHIIERIYTPATNIPIRIFDPCAGEGEAIKAIADHLTAQGAKVQSVAVELSTSRAQQVKQKVDQFIQADYFMTTGSREAFSLIFLNPPYDYDADDKDDGRLRLEQRFLTSCSDRLQPGGLLIYIIPEYILNTPRIVGHLSTQYENVTVNRMPAEEYSDFGQIIITANRRDTPSSDPALKERLSAIGYTKKTGMPFKDLDTELHAINEPDLNKGLWQDLQVPRTELGDKKFYLRKQVLGHQDVIDMLASNSAHDTRDWRDLMPQGRETAFQPPVPLRVGHIGSLISSGQMGTVELDNTIAKGRAAKRTRCYDEQGNIVQPDDKKAVTMREFYQTAIHTISQDGTIKDVSTNEDLANFLKQYAGDIAQILEQRYAPLYLEPTQEEWAALAGLIPTKKLPGAKTAGLLPAQKHVAAASARCVKEHGWVDLIGEMGVGKTSVSLATLHLLNEYPAIVVCPSHLTEKWAREVLDVNPSVTPYIINSLAELQEIEQDFTQGDKIVCIISKERLKLGPGWAHAFTTKPKREVYKTKDETTGHTVSKTRIRRAVACPQCGAVQRDKDGAYIWADEFTSGKAQECSAPIEKFKGDEAGSNSHGEVIIKNREGKPLTCGASLYTYADWKATDHPADQPVHKGINETNPNTIYKLNTFRRWPICKYIKKKMPNFFKVFIADEFHQFKGKSSDQAGAYHNLIDSCKHVINLTGTLFGGKSTDLFWLRYRIDKEARKDFEFHDELRWANQYGRLQFTVQKGESDSDGKFSKATRYNNRAKEIPGISPAIFARLLKTCIFVRITDLGHKLPEYNEEIDRISMSDRQARQYKWMDNLLLDTIKEKMISKSEEDREEATKMLGVWLQNSLARPNSAFRNETVAWRPLGADIDRRYPFMLSKPAPEYGHDTKEDRAPDPQTAHLDAKLAIDTSERFAYLELNDGFEGLFKPQDDSIDSADYDQWFKDKFNEEWGEYMQLLKDGGDKRHPMIMNRIPDKHTLLPKEAWLINYCQEERDNNRKVILYVRQTGTRDIQPRLQRILESAGLRAVTLPNGVTPSKREAWIHKRSGEMDVLITNPKKVETGLDLIQFSTCIFYEVEYSLYTLWQAMRRVWRLGQQDEVKVVFSVYRNTLEEQALNLVGEKMQAALLLYGDSAGSAISDEADSSGDFLSELANKVLNNENTTSDGITGILKNSIPETNTPNQWDDVAQPEIEGAPEIEDAVLQTAAQLQEEENTKQRMKVIINRQPAEDPLDKIMLTSEHTTYVGVTTLFDGNIPTSAVVLRDPEGKLWSVPIDDQDSRDYSLAKPYSQQKSDKARVGMSRNGITTIPLDTNGLPMQDEAPQPEPEAEPELVTVQLTVQPNGDQNVDIFNSWGNWLDDQHKKQGKDTRPTMIKGKRPAKPVPEAQLALF